MKQYLLSGVCNIVSVVQSFTLLCLIMSTVSLVISPWFASDSPVFLRSLLPITITISLSEFVVGTIALFAGLLSSSFLSTAEFCFSYFWYFYVVQALKESLVETLRGKSCFLYKLSCPNIYEMEKNTTRLLDDI